LYVALRFMAQPFMDMLRFIADGGGDVDTIGAMAGALWGAANGIGKLPAAHIEKIEQRARLMHAATALHAHRHG
jgi:ADP-ribosylglycohydrolase